MLRRRALLAGLLLALLAPFGPAPAQTLDIVDL